MAFATEVAVWWALLTGLWLITLSSLSAGEALIAAGCALPAALAAAAARRAMEGAWRPVTRWVTWVGPLVVSIPVDTWLVLAVAARRLLHPTADVGDTVERLHVPRHEGSTGAARAALGTFAVSVTPATMVLDWDADRGEVLVHRLVRSSRSVERAVVR